MPRASTLKGIGLLVGMIVGAGMFALPFTVYEAGFFWSVFHFILVAVVATVVHSLYGSIFYAHYEHHRLPGLIREYLGDAAYRVALPARFFTYYGTLLAYGVLGGLFLSYLMPAFSRFSLSVLFFVVFVPLLRLNLKKAGRVNLFLTVPLILFVVALFFMLMPALEVPDIPLFGGSGSWFLPYGVFLFAFGGASVIPEVVDIFGRRERKTFHAVIVAATFIVAALYLLFVVAVLGIAGSSVSEDALFSLRGITDSYVFSLAVVIGLLAISTSYMALGLEVRYTFHYDLGLNGYYSWALTVFVPLLLFLFGISDFLKILAVVGAIGIGIEGIFIILLARRALRTNIVLVSVLSILLAAGALLVAVESVGLM